VEDVSDKVEDHAAESCRYGLMSRPQPVTGIIHATTQVQEDTIKSDFVMTEDGFRHKSEVKEDDDDGWFRSAGW
jgi:hypothetical protein